MSLYRVQVKLQKTSLVPEDAVINTWWFDLDDDTATPRNDVVSNLLAFYQIADAFMSPSIATTGHTVSFYKMADEKPRVPRATLNLGTLTLGSQPLPEEVAICCSYRGALVSGSNPGRRKGRIFLGPLAVATLTTGANPARPTSAFRDALAGAMDTIEVNSSLSATFTWVQYSPTSDPTDTGSPLSYTPVVAGWVDDAFDTQRRRGVQPSARSTFSA